MTAATPLAEESVLQAHNKSMEMESVPLAMDTATSGTATNSTGTNCPLKHGAEDRDKLSHSSVERASIRSVIRSVRFLTCRRGVASVAVRRQFRLCVPRVTPAAPVLPTLAVSLVASRSPVCRKQQTPAPMAILSSSTTGYSAQCPWWGQ